MMLFDRKLETHALVVNIEALRANVARIQKETYRRATTEAVQVFNRLLWRINRPLTHVNHWLAQRGEVLRHGRKAYKEQTLLDESIHRMVAEGGPPLGDE